MKHQLAWAWAALFLATVGYFFLTLGSLHDHLAVHFDASGNPNGFQSKSGYLGSFPSFVILMNGLFAAGYFFIDRIPAQLIHLPWKEYWFSKPELKTRFFGKFQTVFGLIGIFINFTFLFTVQVIYQANAPAPAFTLPLNAGVFVILALAVFLAAMTLVTLRPPAEG